jgi:hypothetical protein
MTDPDDFEPIRWYADDFETTTDLDGPPEPYTLDGDEIEALADLPAGATRLAVLRRPISSTEFEAYTVTAERHEDGSLTATRRTGRVRVWSWAIAPLDSEHVYTGTSIETYFEKAAELGGVHWFHNLRFDGAFIDSYMCDDQPLGLGMYGGEWMPRHVPVGAFGALISDQGAHYSRYVRLADGRRFEIRDSLKKFPNTTIAALAGMYGAEVGKGEIDYTMERPDGYKPTPEEWEYIRADVAILRTALRVAEAIGNTALTIGGDAMSEYRSTMAHGRFRTIFPKLDRDLDDWIRQAYRGGWTYVNPKYQGQVLDGEGSVWDVNSMYPAVMRQSSYPIGPPTRLAPGQTELHGYPHVIYGALLDATIRPGRLPMIQIKHDARYNPVDYQTEVRGVEWYGTEVDWRLLHEQYHVEIHEWIAGYAFRGLTGLFDRYIDKWMEVKEKASGGMRTQAKFQLNNLWGRFAINPLRAGRLPVIGPDGAIRYELTPQVYDEPAYTPVGVWTTSYGRDRVIRAAQSFGDRFLAGDTDSTHVLERREPGDVQVEIVRDGKTITRWVPPDFEVHDTRLGAWKLEATFERATYLRAKAYAELIVHDDGTREVEAHVAGLPRRLLAGARIEDIAVGTRYTGKLVPRRVPGGVILVSTEFEIGEKDAWGHR